MTNFIHEYLPFFKPLNANSTKWSNTLKQFVGKLPANILSVFDHFVGLALKGFRNKGHWRKKWFVDLIYFSHIQFHQENYWSYDKICDFVNDISQDGISLKSLDHAVVNVKNFVKAKANKLKNILLEKICGRRIEQRII